MEDGVTRILETLKDWKPIHPMKEECLIMLTQLGDPGAREQLLYAHTPFVIKVAKHYRRSPVSMLDLISFGLYGLSKAIDKFEFDRGASLLSYARTWIRWEITEAVHREARCVRPQEMGGYFDDIEWTTPPPQEEDLIWEETWKETLGIIEHVLDERSLGIVKDYYLEGMTLHEVGARYGISYERVRQIKDVALNKARGALELAKRREDAPPPHPLLRAPPQITTLLSWWWWWLPEFFVVLCLLLLAMGIKYSRG